MDLLPHKNAFAYTIFIGLEAYTLSEHWEKLFVIIKRSCFQKGWVESTPKNFYEIIFQAYWHKISRPRTDLSKEGITWAEFKL